MYINSNVHILSTIIYFKYYKSTLVMSNYKKTLNIKFIKTLTNTKIINVQILSEILDDEQQFNSNIKMHSLFNTDDGYSIFV